MLSEIIQWHGHITSRPALDATLDAAVVGFLVWAGHRALRRSGGKFSLLAACIIAAGIFFLFDGALKIIPVHILAVAKAVKPVS